MKTVLEVALGLSWFAVTILAWMTGDMIPAVLWLFGFAYYLGRYNGGFALVRELLSGVLTTRSKR